MAVKMERERESQLVSLWPDGPPDANQQMSLTVPYRFLYYDS